ncbi:Major tail protein [Trichinella spiralis]|uniref:Major tail protein n=1 Tax=Trichinella spiralis TaxID=6334 RepID=A0ABR3K4R8_TRISP
MTEGTPEQAEVTSTLWSKMTRRQLTRSIPINYVQTADASFWRRICPAHAAGNLQYPPPIVCRRTTVRRGRAVVRRAEQRPTLLNDRAHSLCRIVLDDCHAKWIYVEHEKPTVISINVSLFTIDSLQRNYFILIIIFYMETIENGSKCRRYMNIFTFITFPVP